MKKPLRLRQKQKIDNGAFADVYRISKYRVVKVFDPYYFPDRDELSKEEVQDRLDALIKDEIRGSKTSKYALPVLDIIDVVTPDKDRLKGLLRRYIPYEVYDDDPAFEKVDRRVTVLGWDLGCFNCRKDSYGKVWIVDTQTSACLDIGKLDLG